MSARRRAVTFAAALSSLALRSGAWAQPPAKERTHPEPARVFDFKDAELKWEACPAFFPKGCALAPLRGDLDEQDSDVFLKVPEGAAIPRHWHPSAERIVSVAGELHITYDGQKTVVLTPGLFVYGPANLNHKAVCAKGGPCVLFIALAAPVDAEPGTEPEPPKKEAPAPAP